MCLITNAGLSLLKSRVYQFQSCAQLESPRLRSRLEALHGNGEDIPDAALGLYHARGARIALKFAPEAKDLYVDATIENLLVGAGRPQKVLSAKRTLRGFEECDQQRIFTPGQRYRTAGRVDEPPGPAVELPAGKSKAATSWIAHRRGSSDIEPPQDRANPREQFAQVEWLGQIIIGAELKTNDPIDIIATVTSNNDHGHFQIQTDLPKQIEPILRTKPEIENYEIYLGLAKPVDHFLTAICHKGPDIVLREII